jgi:cell division protein FtsB
MLPSIEQKSGTNISVSVGPLRRKRVQPAPSSSSPVQRRWVHFVLIFVTLVLVVDALVGEKGLMESMRARQQYRDVAASLDAARRENARMREEVRRLREDPAAIESLAREELGLIRPGELLFIIKDEKPSR